MNERIRELYVKVAGKDWLYDFDTDKAEMFAELIVRDCALTAGLMEHEGRTGIGAQLLDNYGIT